MLKKALKMSLSVVRNADRLVKIQQGATESSLKQPVLNVVLPQKFHLSQWKAKVTIAASALQREKRTQNNFIIVFNTASQMLAVFCFVVINILSISP